MELATLVGTGGALMLVSAAARTAMAARSAWRRRVQSSRRDRSELAAFCEQASDIYERLDPRQKTPSESWQGARSFRVAERMTETAQGDICSFHVEPVDGAPLRPFEPGQFLSFAIPNGESDVRRCYSISHYPTAAQTSYRVTVKRIGGGHFAAPEGPPGLGSTYFHQQLANGSVVDVFPPAGSFCLDPASNRPVVLIAGGIGITPLLSMLGWLAVSASQREVWLFYGVRSREDHAFHSEIRRLCQNRPNIRVVVFYSRPTPSCRRGMDYDVEGRLHVDVMKGLLKARDYAFYVCGPAAMMTDVEAGLRNWGVPPEAILSERFGAPPTNGASNGVSAGALPGQTHRVPAAARFQVEFARSGKRVAWTARNGTILELAEACGIAARCSCRAGQCGTCKVKVRSGDVRYCAAPESPPEAGACLPCISQPACDIVLDM